MSLDAYLADVLRPIQESIVRIEADVAALGNGEEGENEAAFWAELTAILRDTNQDEAVYGHLLQALRERPIILENPVEG